MFYFSKTPGLLKNLYPHRLWNHSRAEKTIYLTFDDGPHEVATPFVLDQLRRYQARATFFCIGKNVAAYPALYTRILDEGHTTGNHTYDHLNGYKTPVAEYLQNIEKAAALIHSRLFRPPYGRLSSSQARQIKDYRIVMWDVLSGDFDPGLSKERCAREVIKNSRSGSIIVFHDSEKAFEKLGYALPLVLDYFSKSGYRFEAL